MKFTRQFLLRAAVCGALCASPSAAQQRQFTLNDRVFVYVTPDWTERRDVRVPPDPVLAGSAPRLAFSDILVLENRVTPGILQVAFTDNPYIGQDGVALQTRLQFNSGAIAHFFYFFFPPPPSCLARSRAAFEREKREAEDRYERERERARREKTSPPTGPPAARIAARCEFGPEMRDFFAAQISGTFQLSTSRSGDRAEAQLARFFLPSMEQHEIGEMTFFVFEAQAERLVNREDVEKFGFADELEGARVHFFWAIGARTPFPFLRDPQRKDLQLTQVAFATISPSGVVRPLFLDLLRSLRFQP
jgi:hypothetical protein